MFKRFIILFPIFMKFSFGYSESLEMPDSLANQDGIPSSIVNGVNVITGDFCEFNQDIMIPGIAQHHFDRCYHSSDTNVGNICYAWSSNLCGIASIKYQENPGKKKDASYILYYKGPYANFSSFESAFESKHKPSNFTLYADKEIFQKGVTNTGKGYIGAATHPKNNKVYYTKNPMTLTVVDATGQEISFNYSSKDEHYLVSKTKKLNKHQLKYSFFNISQISNVEVCNSENERIAKLEMHYDLKNDPHIQIYGDGGTNVRYNLIGYNYYGQIFWFIKNVTSSRFPMISYEWELLTYNDFDNCIRITRKNLPRDLSQTISYYKINEKLKIKKGDPRLNRVASVGRIIRDSKPKPIQTKPAKKVYEEPVSTYILTNSFVYEIEKPGKGKTTVKYPEKAPTDYHYDKYRLTRITQRIKKDKTTAPYLMQMFSWLDSPNYEGNIEKKSLFTGTSDLLESTSYFYDTKGNVLEEHYLGNLTGNSTFINPKECFIKRNTFLQDKRNLIESTDDGRKKIRYGYYDDSNLLKYKFIIADGRIQIRNFYEYDKNSAMTLEIIDNGCDDDKNNLTSVTQRKIKEIKNRSEFPIGLPQVIFNKALNVSTGQEEILNRTEYFYTCEGWLEREEVYNQNNELISLQRNVYDSQGKVIETYDILGQGTFKQYDESGNVIRIQTPQYDFYTNYYYDFYNRLIKEEIVQTNGEIITKSYQYNKSDNKASETDIYGNKTSYFYDSLNRLIQKELPSGEIQKFDYNCRNQLISQIDHYGNTTTFEYTSRDQPIQIHYPDGKQEQFRYTLDGVLFSSRDMDGTYTQNTFDYLGRLIKKEVYSENGEFLFEIKSEYDAFNLLKEIDAAGNETIYSYDSFGREIKMSKGDHIKETFYDASNRVSEVKISSLKDPDSIITKYQYDLLNRVTCELQTDGEGNIQKEEYFSYDPSGKIIEIISSGHAGISKIKNQYDIFGNLILTIDPEGNKTVSLQRYNYINDQGEVVGYQETTDPLGNIIITIKDIAGHEACIIYKDAFNKELHKTINIYNHVGCLSQKIEHVYEKEEVIKVITKQLFYDNCYRLVSVIEAVGSPLQKELYISYNKSGQKECVKKYDGTYLNYIYGPRGLLKEFLSSDGSIHYRYEYDLLDNITKMTDVLSGTTTERTFNSYNQMTYEKLANGLEMNYTYHITNREKSLILPDKSYIENNYKGAYLDSVQRFSATGELQYQHTYENYDKRGCYGSVTLAGSAGKIDYTYDTLGRIRSTQAKHWQEVIASFDNSGNLKERAIINNSEEYKENFEYDSLYQLISDKYHTYQYDSLHNRLSKDGKLYNTNDLNQITYDGDLNYEYDLCGNLKEIIGKEKIQFSYDALDRLRVVEKEKERFHYIYDAKNRRIAKEKFLLNERNEWKLVSNERYLYQNQCEIGTVDCNGTINTLRIIGSGKASEIGATIALEIEQEIYVPIHDSQGNIASLLLIEDGSVIETYEYSAFGEEIIYDSDHHEKELSIQPWHFSSKRLDLETGFIYFGYRYYSRDLGRWITSDPLGDKDGPNLYAYVKNRPHSLFDSFGLFGEYFDDEFSYPYYHPDALSSISSVVGRGIELGATHGLLPGDLRYGIEGFGLLMQGESFHHDFKMNFGWQSVTVGEGEIALGERQYSILGILSTRDSAIEVGQYISSNTNNTAVTVYYHETGGLLTDLVYSGKLLLGMQDEGVDNLVNEINQLYEEIINKSQKAILNLHNHSMGTITGDCLTDKLPSKVISSMRVYNYGGLIGEDKGYIDYGNIMNRGDPLIAINPKHWFDRSKTNWTNAPMSWNLIKNHYFMGEGYREALLENVKNYYKSKN